MIKAIKKVIVVGGSLGVTLPKEALKDIKLGDRVELWFSKVK